MEFSFHLSAYDDPALDAEVPQALEQRLAARSRAVMPRLWSVTDKLNAHAAKGPGRAARRKENRVCGILLLAIAVFALVPGLTEPQIPSLIWAGLFALVSGVFCLWISKERKPSRPPAVCREEAERLLKRLRGLDLAAEGDRTEVRVDGEGLAFSRGGAIQKQVPWSGLTGIFETGHIWMILYGEDQALVLQKKDLTAGDPADFLPYLQENIGKHTIKTDKESTT